jgi:hypothetical protein
MQKERRTHAQVVNFFKRNASTILTVAGAGGVLLTAVLTGTGTLKAVKFVEKAKDEKGEDLTKLETVRAATPAYIPAAIAGVSTISCIFGANILNQRNQASIASAYVLLDNAYKRYREKVNDLYGEDADRNVLGAIVKEDIDEAPLDDDDIRLFYDINSGRYFEVQADKLYEAENELNKKLITTGYACVNDFYEALGIPKMDYGDKLGWSTYAYGRYYDGCNSIEFYHQPMTLDDGLECCMVYFVNEPSLDYDNY